MEKETRPRYAWLAAAAAALMVLVFVAGLMLGRGSKPPAPTVAPGTVATSDAGSSALGRASAGQIDALRRGVPVDQEAAPLPMARVENVDRKRTRAYPMQPPTIPHAIDGYEVSRNANRCMLCHARANAEQFQAPPVSVTHYMDRDDQFLATISPRRYFCNQCHVVQTDARPLVANTFQDIDAIIAASQSQPPQPQAAPQAKSPSPEAP